MAPSSGDTRQRLAVPLYGMGMVAADYDNDGDSDLVVTGYQETRLFRNDGQGKFTDITCTAGIAPGGWSTAAAFVDVDRDGWLDLLIGHYVAWEPASEEGWIVPGHAAKDTVQSSIFQGWVCNSTATCGMDGLLR